MASLLAVNLLLKARRVVGVLRIVICSVDPQVTPSLLVAAVIARPVSQVVFGWGDDHDDGACLAMLSLLADRCSMLYTCVRIECARQWFTGCMR